VENPQVLICKERASFRVLTRILDYLSAIMPLSAKNELI
jgi:hypothetical protein